MWTKVLTISLVCTQIYAVTVNPICTSVITEDFDPVACCEIPDYNVDDFNDVIEECTQLYKNDTGIDADYSDQPWTFSELNCFGECILNKTGVLKDTVFQLDVAVNLLSKMYNSLNEKSSLMPLIREGFKICESKIRTLYKLNSSPEEGFCSDYSVYLFACVDTHIFKNCPVNLWNTTESCENTKATSKQCLVLEDFLWAGVPDEEK